MTKLHPYRALASQSELLQAAAKVSRLLQCSVPDDTDRAKLTASIAEYTDVLLRTVPRPEPCKDRHEALLR